MLVNCNITITKQYSCVQQHSKMTVNKINIVNNVQYLSNQLERNTTINQYFDDRQPSDLESKCIRLFMKWQYCESEIQL